MRPMPKARTLEEAVHLVIESNRSDGYSPNRFIGITEGGSAENLLGVCIRLIDKGEILDYLAGALERHPTLLTLEDFVSRTGSTWGFSDSTVQNAQARVKLFDTLAGGARYGMAEG